MQASHVADDFAAIARRLKELQKEDTQADERASAPAAARVWMGYPTGRGPQPVKQPGTSGRR